LALLALAAAVPAQNQGLVLTNGTTGHLDVPYSPTLAPASGVTAEAWITYNSSLGSGWRFPTIFRMDPSPNSASYFLRVEAGQTMANRLLWWVSTPNGNFSISWFYTPGALSTWTHVAGTYDGSTLRIIVNGVQVAQGLGTGAILNNPGVFRIGSGDLTVPGGETWNGEIDEVRVWPFARSAAAIASTMNMRLDGLPGEVSTWNLDGDAQDSSGTNDGGALAGTAAFAANSLVQTVVPFSGSIAFGHASGCNSNALAAVNAVPNIGNGAFAFAGTRAPVTPAGFLVLGLAGFPTPIPIFGIDLFVDPTVVVLSLVTPSNLGTAQVALPIPADPLLVGFTLCSQWLWFDGSCPSGFSASNAIVTSLVP
ncbi:MAG TPA: LamG domain-containing protein, partial [Planctomycetota bacterium]